MLNSADVYPGMILAASPPWVIIPAILIFNFEMLSNCIDTVKGQYHGIQRIYTFLWAGSRMSGLAEELNLSRIEAREPRVTIFFEAG